MSRLRMPQADFTSGPVFKNMLRFFLPIMLGTLLQQLYSAVDAVILGRYVGKTALAAVGGSDIVLINLIVGFFVGLSSGAAVVISQHYGANEPERVQKSVHTAIALSLVIGAFMTLVGILVTPRFLTALKTPADTMQYSADYLRWYFAGMIPSMVYNMGSGILRAVGDSRRPLYFLFVCAVLNTVLDLLFVAVFHMEVAGAAIATSFSQLVCAWLVVRTLARQKNCCRLELRRLGFEKDLLKRMLYIGLPAGLSSTMYGVTNLFVQKAINLLGTDTVAAWSAFWKLDGIFWPISGAIGIAVMTFAGQNYGARNTERIYKSIRAGLVLHVTFSVSYSLLLFFLREPAIRLFCSDADVVRQGVQITSWISLTYVTIAFTEILSSAMRGVGNAVKPTLLTLLGVCVLRLTLLFTITFPHLSNATIALCYPVTWTAASILFLLYFKFGKWMPEYKPRVYESEPL